MDDLKAIALELSDLADSYEEKSEANVYTLNHTDEAVLLDEKLVTLLQESVRLSSSFNGYLSPFLGSLKAMWMEALEAGRIPSEESIQNELLKVKNTTLSFDGNTVTKNGEATIELGAFAKGYCLRLIQEYLRKNGIKQYLVNGGRSAALLGEKPTKDGLFTVSFRDLAGRYLLAKNVAISTSSIYEQNWVVDGLTYSHLLNPKNGQAEHALSLVVALGEDPLYLDAASTAICLMGEAGKTYEGAGLSLLYSKNGSALDYVSPNYEVHAR